MDELYSLIANRMDQSSAARALQILEQRSERADKLDRENRELVQANERLKENLQTLELTAATMRRRLEVFEGVT